jgi:hypothetical protein
MSFINKMSDAAPVDATIPVPAPAVAPLPDAPASASISPAAAVAATVSPVGVDLKDPVQLLSFSLKVVKEVKALADLSDADKSKLIVGAVKTAVSSSDLPDVDKAISLSWCDAVLPHVVDTVALVEADLKKVEVVVAKKCCPAAAPKKVEAVPAKNCCPSFLSHFFH